MNYFWVNYCGSCEKAEIDQRIELQRFHIWVVFTTAIHTHFTSDGRIDCSFTTFLLSWSRFSNPNFAFETLRFRKRNTIYADVFFELVYNFQIIRWFNNMQLLITIKEERRFQRSTKHITITANKKLRTIFFCFANSTWNALKHAHQYFNYMLFNRVK